MSIGSATRRAAGAVAGGFALSAVANFALLQGTLAPRQLGWLLVVHGIAALVTLAGLVFVSRWWLRGGEPLMAQLDAAGKGRIAERPQDGPFEWAVMSCIINVVLICIKV